VQAQGWSVQEEGGWRRKVEAPQPPMSVRLEPNALLCGQVTDQVSYYHILLPRLSPLLWEGAGGPLQSQM
jgi:hypothetical protein